MKLINTQESKGKILCHDITEIIKDARKGAAFRKGHIITEEDIPVLLNLGKDHIYIMEEEPGMVHENDAAEVLVKLCEGANIGHGEVKEGKIELHSLIDGVLKIDRKKLLAVNSLGEMMIASVRGDRAVRKGAKLAGTRIIPLLIKEEKLQQAVDAVGAEPIFRVIAFNEKKIGLVTTGNEVFYGRIKDTFTPVIYDKLKEFNQTVSKQAILNDDHVKITDKILEFIEEEQMDMIICTGGMSVDPDDRTPLAIKNTGAEVVSYGAPVLPGAMFMLAYYKDSIPIVGLPGCVMYAKKTAFDLFLPRLLADDKIYPEDIYCLGEGGLGVTNL